tara:strand:+ start:145 stop:528 length:384 start_codon:yes stop_codon:yes gene_type:complete
MAKKSKVKVKTKVRPLSSRYSFDIISLSANSKERLTEIEYKYTGVLLVPKHLKKSLNTKRSSVSGLYIIDLNVKSSITNKSYRDLKKKEVIDFLKNNLRKDYLLGIKKIIDKEIYPEDKKLNVFPWE